MAELPKIVRERLQQAEVFSSHPDANTLTAFSERVLPRSQRDMVMEHLARCAECREVISLALPELASPLVEASKQGSPGWFTWPALRWGVVAAAGAIAVAAISLHHPDSQKTATASQMNAHEEIAQNLGDQGTARSAQDAAKVQPPTKSEIPSAPTVNATSGLANAQNPRGNHAIARFAQPPKPASAPVTASGGGGVGSGAGPGLPVPAAPASKDQRDARQYINSPDAKLAESSKASAANTNLDKAAAPAVPAITESVTVESAAPQITAQNEIQDLPVQGRVVQEQKQLATENGDVTRAKAAPEPQGAHGALVGGLPSQSQLARVQSAPARWTIGPAGTLQRSVDGGNTWTDVSVIATRPYATDLMQTASSTASVEKSRSAAPAKKTQIPPATPPSSLVFRAVTAMDSDVWAGANAGMLFHSPDAGVTWTRVIPAAAGSLLTGDVIRIEFSDPQNGKVQTSTSETWTTSDAGQSWQKK